MLNLARKMRRYLCKYTKIERMFVNGLTSTRRSTIIQENEVHERVQKEEMWNRFIIAGTAGEGLYDECVRWDFGMFKGQSRLDGVMCAAGRSFFRNSRSVTGAGNTAERRIHESSTKNPQPLFELYEGKGPPQL